MQSVTNHVHGSRPNPNALAARSAAFPRRGPRMPTVSPRRRALVVGLVSLFHILRSRPDLGGVWQAQVPEQHQRLLVALPSS